MACSPPRGFHVPPAHRTKREQLIKAAPRWEDLVWRLDRWGRSVADLAVTLKELNELGVAFVSLTEAIDLATPTGRAMNRAVIRICRT